ncbi:unnamed protein product [Blepharisma stoltei]|uniref:Uncharacterized protein n=1 Tax=Blepharisma stoltei TaxID=1481888 RepID=A0AAU9IUQ1_9CILI|nr:unnamed protein product [Blepharisma stoltei]
MDSSLDSDKYSSYIEEIDQSPTRRVNWPQNSNSIPGPFPIERQTKTPTIDLKSPAEEAGRMSATESFVSMNIFTSRSPDLNESPFEKRKNTEDISIENISVQQHIFCADCKCSRQIVCSLL